MLLNRAFPQTEADSYKMETAFYNPFMELKVNLTTYTSDKDPIWAFPKTSEHIGI